MFFLTRRYTYSSLSARHRLDSPVDLTLRHYERIVTLSTERPSTLEALVGLFAALATSARPAVASCGVGAMHRLLSGAGDAMDADDVRSEIGLKRRR